jgi:predicted ester cyclase
MREAENAALIRRYVDEVWNRANLEPIAALWTNGRADECRAGWLAHHHQYPGGRFTLDDLIVQSDRVVARWTFHGMRPQWTLRDTAAPGESRPMTLTGITIWHIREGQLVEGYFESEGPGLYV